MDPIPVIPFRMGAKELLEEVQRVFPPVEKPGGLELSFHKVGCGDCAYLRTELEKYTGRELPVDAIRWIATEMSCLSAKGWRWVLPSYLKWCVGVDDTYNGLPTEFLIYTLAPNIKRQKETRQRMSELNGEQIACLVHFIEWCASHEYWSDYCPEEISLAHDYLCSIRV